MNVVVDVAVIGGSMGGVAAALAVRDAGYRVILTEPTRWIGGQMTAQGVSAFDEHAHIETFGGTATYNLLRQRIRESYPHAPAIMPESVLGPDMPLNPGNGWVSRLCFDPRVGVRVLEDLLHGVTLLTEHTPIAVKRDGTQIQAVILRDRDGREVRIAARYFLDATDLGDLLPLAGIPYVTGAEADTGEPGTPDVARPNEVQSFTCCFAVEYRPGEDHTIPKPAGYESFRQFYTLQPTGRDGQPVIYRMFNESEQGNPPFWTYRRIHDGALLGGNDITLINWVSNDYFGGNIIDSDAADHYLDEAKRLSLGFLHWLQTECPRDDGGTGYPELMLRPDVMGTDDGLAQAPYIRESRRIVPQRRIVAQDIATENNPGARAQHFKDSVGLGWYAMDLHPCVGNPHASLYAPTKPFQIPLGALLPQTPTNLLPACKNIGTTHLTNGAYRLHPTEWNIGEAVGTLAAFCLRHETTPHTLDDAALWRLQYALVKRGVPLVWTIDVPPPLFIPTQLLLVRDVIRPGGARWQALTIEPDQPLGDDFDLAALESLLNDSQPLTANLTWRAVCDRFDPGAFDASL